MDRAVVPPGWPAGVLPPGVPGWEGAAANWLLDICPPDYRGYAVLRRQVVVLARFAAVHIEASRHAARQGLSETRAVLRDVTDPDTTEAAVAAWQAEEARLISVQRGVALIEEALRGRRFVARL